MTFQSYAEMTYIVTLAEQNWLGRIEIDGLVETLCLSFTIFLYFIFIENALPADDYHHNHLDSLVTRCS